MRLSGPPKTRSRYQSPTTLPGLRAEPMSPSVVERRGLESPRDTEGLEGEVSKQAGDVGFLYLPFSPVSVQRGLWRAMLAPQAREGCARLCDARLKLGIRRAPGASDPSIIPRGFVTLAQSLRHTGALEHERHGVIVQPLPHPRRSRVKTTGSE